MLAIKEISKRFGGVQAVNAVSFDVAAGRIVGLIGPNGAGKTTLFNIVSGFLPGDSGEIYFSGAPIHALPPHERAALGIGRTFQHVQLMTAATVLENVMVGLHLRGTAGATKGILRTRAQRCEEHDLEARARDALVAAELSYLADTTVADLPYGLQKRVEFVRALASQPKLLLLDEPAAGLNDAETDELGELICAARNSGVTVLVVEHAMPLVMGICDHIVVVDFGRKIAEGTPEQVRSNPLVIDAYLGSGPETAGHA